MGFLDGLLGNLFSDDPQKQAQMAMAFGLLGGAPGQRKNFGADVMNAGLLGVNTYGQAQQQERANRQSDIQQLSTASQLLRQQEFQRQAQMGDAYTPNPLLGQIDQRLSGLVLGPNLSKLVGGAQTQTAPPAPTPPPAPVLPAPEASKYSLAVDPSIRKEGPMPSPNPARPAPGRWGGPAGGIPMAQWAIIDPTGKAYAEQLAKDNQPVPLRQGDLVKQNADGTYSSVYQQPQMDKGILPQRNASGQVTSAAPIPGYLPAISSLEGAKTTATEAAQFPFRTTPVQTASGATIPMLLSKVVGNPSSQSTQNQPQIPPEILSAAASGQPFVGTVSPNGQTTITKQGDPWATIPKRPVPQGVGMTTYDQERQKQYAEQASSLSSQLGTQADAASQRIAYNNEAKRVLTSANTGPLAQQLSGLGNLLVSFGVPAPLIAKAGIDPTATDELNKFLINSATQRAKQIYGPRLAQAEVMLQVKQASPSLGMTKAAIQTLLDIDNRTAEHQITQANDFGKYDAAGGDPSRFLAWHTRAFPLTKELDLSAPPQAAQASGKPTMQDIENEILRRRQGR